MSMQYAISQIERVEETNDDGGNAEFVMPSMEIIDASWERVSRILDERRSRQDFTYAGRTRSALHFLETEAIISLYKDARASKVSDDFLQLIESILLEREFDGQSA